MDNHRRVNSITYGAMMTALLGVLLFVNRQLAGAFDTFLFWIIPVLVIVYCGKFTTRRGLVLGAAMLAVTFIISTPATVFYVAGSLIAGLVYSLGMDKGWSSAGLAAAVFAVSLAMAVVTTFIAPAFFGYDLTEELAYYKQFIQQAGQAMNLSSSVIAALFTDHLILALYVLACVLTSVMEGILVHLLAFIVLRKLKMKTPPMTSLSHLKANVWVKSFVLVAFAAALLMNGTVLENYREIVTVAAVTAYVLCAFYGYLLTVVLLSWKVPDARKRALWVIPIVLLFLFVPPVPLILGLTDMFTNARERIAGEINHHGS